MERGDLSCIIRWNWEWIYSQEVLIVNEVVNPRSAHIPKVFVVRDQSDTAPVWGYILRQRGLNVILETSLEKAVHRWSTEIPDLVVIDIDVSRGDPLELCRKFREVSVAPLLLFLPTHHETQIIEAYAASADEVVVKPISPAIFPAKIMAWVRRSWSVPVDGLSLVKAGSHRLDPARRCVINPDGLEIKLTNLKFRLLLLLKNVVYRLRRKIEADPSHPILLQTWQGGYSFQE